MLPKALGIECVLFANTKSYRIRKSACRLKVHLRHLAVNFLPQYFITLLFSLTCVLTITRRKRPKSGPKTRFQSDFYTLLIIISNNSRASFTVFSDSSHYSYEL